VSVPGRRNRSPNDRAFDSSPTAVNIINPSLVPRAQVRCEQPAHVSGWKDRRLSGIDDLVISLSAKGLTHGDISAHLTEVYGAEVSKQTVSAITDCMMDGMVAWGEQAAGCVYPVIFINWWKNTVRQRSGRGREYPRLSTAADKARALLDTPDALEGRPPYLTCFEPNALRVSAPRARSPWPEPLPGTATACLMARAHVAAGDLNRAVPPGSPRCTGWKPTSLHCHPPAALRSLQDLLRTTCAA
jgi:hypothetical protein